MATTRWRINESKFTLINLQIGNNTKNLPAVINRITVEYTCISWNYKRCQSEMEGARENQVKRKFTGC